MQRRSGFAWAVLMFAGGCGMAESPDDRAAALWAISKGGGASLTVNDLVIRDATRLPAEPFRVDGIDLNNQKIDEADLAKLESLEHLRYLHLYDSGITDAGLEHIARIASLEELELSYNDVTDEGLQQLAPLANMKTLFARGTGVTPDGAEGLRAARPKLTIHVR
ncbi:MAG: hypothetical protein WD066_01750 [Planctomycetaceae bacterium]